MIAFTSNIRFPGLRNPSQHGICLVSHLLHLTFVTGPKLLLTSRITGKCAAAMAVMCSPALLFCSILTIPALLFQSPQQHAYFYFSRMLEQDPARWIVLILAGICAIMSLAVPATIQNTESSVSY
jgi:hypothetical protein